MRVGGWGGAGRTTEVDGCPVVGGMLSEFAPVIMCAALSLHHHITVSVSIPGVLELDPERSLSGGGFGLEGWEQISSSWIENHSHAHASAFVAKDTG